MYQKIINLIDVLTVKEGDGIITYVASFTNSPPIRFPHFNSISHYRDLEEMDTEKLLDFARGLLTDFLVNSDDKDKHHGLFWGAYLMPIDKIYREARPACC